MSKARVIAEALRSLGDLGTTNYAKDKKLCYDAADLIEDQEERIDIMMEGNKITPGSGIQMELDYEYRDEIRQ